MVEQTKIFKVGAKQYEVDSYGFLIDPRKWDENYAEALAEELEIPDGLTDKHWKIIRFIRNYIQQNNVCPNIYTTCRNFKLKLKDLQKLFPTGYHRGACKLAGLTYKEGYVKYYYWDNVKKPITEHSMEKTYHVDCNGFLLTPEEWDEQFAICKGLELKMQSPLSEKHWNVIKFLRDYYTTFDKLPNIYETCEANYLDIADMEMLFPDGYHRGAVKLSGLRLA